MRGARTIGVSISRAAGSSLPISRPGDLAAQVEDTPEPTDVRSPTRSLTRLESFAYSLVVVLASYLILEATAPILIPLVVAIMLAVLFAPMMSWAERRDVPQFVSMLAVMVVIVVTVVGAGLLVYFAWAQVAGKSEEYLARASTTQADLAEWSRERTGYDFTQLLLEGASDTKEMVGRVIGHFNSVANGAGIVMFVFLFLGFILIARRALREKLAHVLVLAELRSASEAQAVLDRINEQVRAYLWFKTIISVLTGVAFGFAALVCGLDFPLVWGILGCVLHFIPSIGPIVSCIPPTAIAFLQFSPVWALTVSVVMWTVMIVSGNVVEPILMGDRLNLNFIVVLVCIPVFWLFWGAIGMFLAVPVTACINIVLAESSRYRALSELLAE